MSKILKMNLKIYNNKKNYSNFLKFLLMTKNLNYCCIEMSAVSKCLLTVKNIGIWRYFKNTCFKQSHKKFIFI